MAAGLGRCRAGDDPFSIAGSPGSTDRRRWISDRPGSRLARDRVSLRYVAGRDEQAHERTGPNECVYTGKTEQPCCLCGDPDTATRLDLPPRAVRSMKNAGSIAWRDIVGEVSIHFCESDWALVTDLVLDVGVNPLPRCNAARASLDIREDFEALLNDVRDEPDQTPLESRMIEESERTIAVFEDDDLSEKRDLVEARIRLWVLEDAGASVEATGT